MFNMINEGGRLKLTSAEIPEGVLLEVLCSRQIETKSFLSCNWKLMKVSIY